MSAKLRYAGWRNAWDLYPHYNFTHGIYKAFIPFIPLCIAILLADDKYKSIGYISGLVTSTFPSIIGFILAGYAILIGCGNIDIMRKICKKKANKSSSIFQRTSSTFALVMGSLILTFLICFITKLIFDSGLFFAFPKGCDEFNTIVAIIISYLACYSIWALLDITINIFNFSQFINSQIQKDIPNDILNHYNDSVWSGTQSSESTINLGSN